ncbi:MAG: ribonuclease HII, partial [Lactococcus plantarum]|nr:ribonuclease HII [Lactococcus plantarum]
MATIKAIGEQLLLVAELTDPLFELLEQDERLGVQKLVAKRKRQLLANIAEAKRLESLLAYERELY